MPIKKEIEVVEENWLTATNNNKMTPKQLIVAVEGTAAVAPFWRTMLSDYLHKIIKCFCDQVSMNSLAELSLVVFNSHRSYSGACLVQRSGWTKDMDTFFQWLSAIPFSGGGFGDVAVAEGLAEALMMFSCPNGSQNLIMDGQKHCILVAASNPNSVPTLFYNPDIVESQPDNHLPSAETLAKSFAECGISLSVICLKELLKLKSIYRAGKQNPRAADLLVDNVKNPHFLVLLSENFVEGRAALSCFASGGAATITPKLNSINPDMISSTRPVPSGMGSNQNMMSGHCSSSSVTRMPSNQQSSNILKSKKSGYSKVWEGRLYEKRRGQRVFVTRLVHPSVAYTCQSPHSKLLAPATASFTCPSLTPPFCGYTNISASVILTENWPAMMVIDRLVSVDSIKQYFGNPLPFVFRALTQHWFLDQLQERKLCAVIKLASERLVLSVSDKKYRLIGLLFPQDIRLTPNPSTLDSEQLQAQLLELQAQEQQLQAQLQDFQAQYIQGQLLAQQQLQAQQEQLSMQRQQVEALWQQLQSQEQLQQNQQKNKINFMFKME